MGNHRVGSARRGPVVSLVLLGIVSILAQVVLVRELAVVSYGVELVCLLTLGVWLGATGLGAFLGLPRRAVPSTAVGALFLLLSMLLPLDVLFLRGSRELLGGIPGAYLPLGTQAVVLLGALLPICLVLGALFSASARWHLVAGGSLPTAYAWESVGSVLGGGLAGLGFRLGAPTLGVALFCGLGATAGALAAFVGRRGEWPRVAALVLTASLLASGFAVREVDLWTAGWEHLGVLLTHDSPYGRVAVARVGSQVAVFENGALSSESEGTEAEAFVHLVAPQVRAPRRVLLLGGSTEGLVGEVLRYAPDRIDCVEIDEKTARAVVPLLPSPMRQALASETVRRHFGDPREFLRRAGVYDLILVALPEPTSGQTNRYFTRQFFAECSARLAAGGVLGFRLPSAETYRGPLDLLRAASIYRAARTAFPDVLVLRGAVSYFVAGREPPCREADEISLRLEQRGIRGRLLTPAFVRYAYREDRVDEAERPLLESHAPINDDERPVCYRYAAALWLARFFPRLGGPWGEVSWSPGRTAIVLLAAMVVFVASRPFPTFRRLVLAGSSGFVGMTVECALLLHYQTKEGVLYQDFGALTAAFMAGLAVGAWAVHRRISQAGSSAQRATGAALAGGACALCLLLAVWVRSSAGVSLGLSGAALGLAGFLAAGLFVVAGSRADVAGGRLYGADLLGGCLGSLATGLWLIPGAGLGATLVFAAGAALAALVLL